MVYCMNSGITNQSAIPTYIQDERIFASPSLVEIPSKSVYIIQIFGAEERLPKLIPSE